MLSPPDELPSAAVRDDEEDGGDEGQPGQRTAIKDSVVLGRSDGVVQVTA